jgi:probable HAF family extracellular repeat protein
MAKSTRPATLSRRAFSFSVLAAAAAAGGRLQAQTSPSALYDATDLGQLSGGYEGAKAIAINQRGQVAGNLDNSVRQANEGFLWTPGGTDGPPENPAMCPLGNLSGRPDWIFKGSLASALNFNGQVVGCADGTGRLVDTDHACLWQPDGRALDLGTLIEGGAMSSMAMGINNIGKIVGWSDSDYGTLDWFKHRRAFIYEIGARRMIDLGVDHSEANGINDWNQIVGAYYPDEFHQHAAYWDPSGRGYDLHELVTAGGGSSKATAINDRGQIVGWADDAEPSSYHGFCYDLRTGVVKHAEVGSVDGMHQSKIYALNNQGQAVGTFRPHMSGYHALLWNVETDEVEDLNRCLPPEQQWPQGDSSPSPSYWNLQEAWGINDRHQIVGSGSHFSDGHYLDSAFLLNQR